MAETVAATPHTPHPAPHRERIGVFWLWFGIFAAPVAWNLQLLVATAFSGHLCYPDQYPLGPAQAGFHMSWVLAVIDVTGIMVALIALTVASVNWRRVHQEKEGSGQHLLDAGEGRTRFMAMLGIANSLLFLLALIFASFNLFFFPMCP
jgi:hypothetical protein